MKLEELNIGNILINENDYVIVIEFFGRTIHFLNMNKNSTKIYYDSIKNFQPILLNAEIRNKLGFNNYNRLLINSTMFDEDCIECFAIEYCTELNRYKISHYYDGGNIGGVLWLNHCDYLHELQNIVYVHTKLKLKFDI